MCVCMRNCTSCVTGGQSRAITAHHRFLQGSCQRSPCLLSHAVTLAKMPTCRFFLAGRCVREDCPYLHKKLNARALVCEDFVRGFCARAEQCDRRHEHLCPEWARTGGKCERTRCPYPHPAAATGDERKQPAQGEAQAMDTTAAERSDGTAAAAPSAPSGTTRSMAHVLSKVRKMKTRYADAKSTKTDDEPSRAADVAAEESSASAADDVLVLIPTRPKLGALPAYIPL